MESGKWKVAAGVAPATRSAEVESELTKEQQQKIQALMNKFNGVSQRAEEELESESCCMEYTRL